MRTMDADVVRQEVRRTYGAIAATAAPAGCCGGSTCCGTGAPGSSDAIGYSDEERASVPEGADLGLGCGNPHGLATLRLGERVLDLGSGAGFDALLAARQVGAAGRVIGVDMTPEMIARAEANAAAAGVGHVEFRLGEIEHLPVADASVDVILSNCVINLSPDKAAVFREAHRVLAPGGRLAIADIVALAPLPEAIAGDMQAYTGCVAGASPAGDVERMLIGAGFRDVHIDLRPGVARGDAASAPGSAAGLVAAALIQARKPTASEVEACCDSTLLERCCTPEVKPSCCAPTDREPVSCGCTPGR